MSHTDREPKLAYSPAVLEQVPIFKGLGDHERLQLARLASTLLFQPGEYVLRQGEIDQKLWLIISGQCEVLRSRGPGDKSAVRLALLGPYENFGEMSFFDRAEHSASVRATTAVELLCIEYRDFKGLLESGSPAACKLAINAIGSVAERLRRMDDWVIRLLSNGAAQPRVEEWENFRKQLFSGWKL
jgi:CRP-like cAMP-binding protein